MSGDRRLIVNADDFGRSPGINRAIIDCHAGGIVSSTTLMVNLPWTGEAVALWRAHPSLGLGLHLNFCYGTPVSDPNAVPSLVDREGCFVTDTCWLAANASPDDVVRETQSQLERFVQLVGRWPTHLDSHKYLHSAGRVRDAVIDVAAQHRLPVRAATDEDRSAIKAAGLQTTDRFESRFHGLDGIGVTREVLATALRDMTGGVTELMCHPGYVDEHIQDSSYAADREREVDALTAPEIRVLIDQLGIRLITFADI